MKRGFYNSRKFCWGVSAFLIVILAVIQPAYAYLDPGAGSAILQGILAGIVAIGVVAKIYWHRLLKFFGLRKEIDDSEKD